MRTPEGPGGPGSACAWERPAQASLTAEADLQRLLSCTGRGDAGGEELGSAGPYGLALPGFQSLSVTVTAVSLHACPRKSKGSLL